MLAFLLFSFFIVLPILGVSSYYGYNYTESTEFCGRLCHSVMEPEATAHAHSPHARVPCAACHIGAGASWFVKSKLSGIRQVLAVWENSYRRPIPNAITELRPARETCEECHWPAKFFGLQYHEAVNYSPDEHNTRRVVRLLLKTGGADQSIGRVEGIHMHMVLAARIEYVAVDSELQEIPWVRYQYENRPDVIYRSDGLPADAPRPAGLVRQVDCMDCHNRGAHHFLSPQAAVDLFLNVDRIDATLPFIKREAVATLVKEYPNVSAAEAAIATALGGFYRGQYPKIWESRRAAVEKAITSVQTIYRTNFFPDMRVSWRTYPENIGHLDSPGCLRCHDGRHVNQSGQAISSNCNVCHECLNPLDTPAGAFAPGEFQHALSMVGHEKLQCHQCHTGGALPLCRDCHASGEWLEERGRGMFRGEGQTTQP